MSDPWLYDAPLASEAQKALLRRLCVEQDGEVDEDWLEGLSVAEAAQEIDRRKDWE